METEIVGGKVRSKAAIKMDVWSKLFFQFDSEVFQIIEKIYDLFAEVSPISLIFFFFAKFESSFNC